MEFRSTSLPGVVLIEPTVLGDARGFFMEIWRREEFLSAGIDATFVQENHSRSVRHTLRGLHYQIRRPQGKLVRVVSGELFDVAVDLRRSSPHFGSWAGAILSEHNKHQVWVPPGFAHGFLVLSESADIVYRCTDYYAPEHERCIAWDDAEIGIDWPLPTGGVPRLSRKDAAGARFSVAEIYP